MKKPAAFNRRSGMILNSCFSPDVRSEENLRSLYCAGTKATRTNMHSLRGAINNYLNVTNVRLLLCQRTTGNL